MDPSLPAETAPSRRPGPTPRLSTQLIADAVIEVGFDRASMTAVAGHLGVAHGALYRYVGDREGMMRVALATVTSRHEWPALVDGWRDVVWNEARAWWVFCEEHPGFVTVLASTPGMPEPMASRSLAVSVHLRDLGVRVEDALVVVDMVVDMIHDIFHRASQRQGVIDRALAMPSDEFAEQVAGVPDDMLDVLASALIDDPWPWFARKVDVILDGVAARAGLDA